MNLQTLQEQYDRALERAGGYSSEELTDLTLMFWQHLETYLDSTSVVYQKSRQSEAIYIECIREINEDGDIEDFRTILVAMHDNGQNYHINYIMNDFEDMMDKLKQIITTETGVYCELN